MAKDTEQLYMFVDKTGYCWDHFAKIKDDTPYHRHVAMMFRKNRYFSVGDMLAFRNVLQTDGFLWGKDFYAKKV